MTEHRFNLFRNGVTHCSRCGQKRVRVADAPCEHVCTGGGPRCEVCGDAILRSFYIASSRDRLEDVCALAAHLERLGMVCSFAWWTHLDHACSVERCDIADRMALAAREMTAAGACDLFIGLDRMGKGAHVELGVALAIGVEQRIILVGVAPSASVFYGAYRVEHVADLAALRTLLGGA